MNIEIEVIWAEIGKLYMQNNALVKENARLQSELNNYTGEGSMDGLRKE